MQRQRDESYPEGDATLARSPFGDFVVRISGADPNKIDDATERSWYQTLSVSMLLTALAAFGSMLMLIGALAPALAWSAAAFGGALFWGLIVFVIDRLIISKVLLNPTKSAKRIQFWSRMALVIVVACTISEGWVLTIFGPEITEQVQVDNQRKAASDLAVQEDLVAAARTIQAGPQQQITDRIARLNQDVTDAKTAEEFALLVQACESQGPQISPKCATLSTGQAGANGPQSQTANAEVERTRANKAAAENAKTDYLVTPKPVPDALTPQMLVACNHAGATELSQRDAQQCAIDAAIENAKQATPLPDRTGDGLLRRVVAVLHVGHGDGWGPWDWLIVWAVHFAIFLVLMVVDIVPLVSKFSGTTGHDLKVRANYRPRTPHFLDGDLPKEALVAAAGARTTYYQSVFGDQVETGVHAARAHGAVARAGVDRSTATHAAESADEAAYAAESAAQSAEAADFQADRASAARQRAEFHNGPRVLQDPRAKREFAASPSGGLLDVRRRGRTGESRGARKLFETAKRAVLPDSELPTDPPDVPRAGDQPTPAEDHFTEDGQRIRADRRNGPDARGWSLNAETLVGAANAFRDIFKPATPDVGNVLEADDATRVRLTLTERLTDNAGGRARSQTYDLWKAVDERGREFVVKSCSGRDTDAGARGLEAEARFCAWPPHPGVIETGKRVHRDTKT
ncbi:DUF4407 domain-containing protein, partial [Nocardia salmonicida]|uniref:DUF4407 domain-containing protein n=1 Tax=Nocardia salmonicida TaxID=53431 RepID=UPI0036487A90